MSLIDPRLYVWTEVYSVLQHQPESDFRFKRDEMNAAAKPALL